MQHYPPNNLKGMRVIVVSICYLFYSLHAKCFFFVFYNEMKKGVTWKVAVCNYSLI